MLSSDTKQKLKISLDETIASNSEIFFTNNNKEAEIKQEAINNNDIQESKDIQIEQTQDGIEIPQEIELLAKDYSNYSITIDSFIKYKFYKKYCVNLANN